MLGTIIGLIAAAYAIACAIEEQMRMKARKNNGK
jgi:hypothetical protein